jgi:hypothetical protein
LYARTDYGKTSRDLQVRKLVKVILDREKKNPINTKTGGELKQKRNSEEIKKDSTQLQN